MRDGGFRIQKLSPVGKGIGRGVDDPDDQSVLREVKLAGTEFPDHPRCYFATRRETERPWASSPSKAQKVSMIGSDFLSDAAS